MWRSIIGGIISAYTLILCLPFLLPEHPVYYQTQHYAGTLSTVLLGTGVATTGNWLRFPAWANDIETNAHIRAWLPTYDVLRAGLCLGYAVCVGLFFISLSKSCAGWFGLTCFALINMLVGGLMVLIWMEDDGKRWHMDATTCQQTVNASMSIRVDNFSRWQGYDTFFSVVEGDRWTPFLKVSSWIYRPSCESIDGYNDQFFWVCLLDGCAITHNAGDTWYFWEYSEAVEQAGITDPHTWQIFDVHFRTETRGVIVISRSLEYTRDGWTYESMTLSVIDDGRQWHLEDN